MSKLVIFTQRVEIVESYGERRDCADQRISDFLSNCGYVPLAFPNHANLIEPIVESLNPVGIVLTGGNSLIKYGGNAPERDDTDRGLIEIAVKKRIPVFGFCRGMQSILDYFGNELETISGHVAVRHMIEGLDEKIEVNSYHNQGCLENKNENLEVIMRSEDGVIEKIRHKEYPIIGIMWHPEREQEYRKDDIKMLQDLFG